jgi:hypothetical protein
MIVSLTPSTFLVEVVMDLIDLETRLFEEVLMKCLAACLQSLRIALLHFLPSDPFAQFALALVAQAANFLDLREPTHFL